MLQSLMNKGFEIHSFYKIEEFEAYVRSVTEGMEVADLIIVGETYPKFEERLENCIGSLGQLRDEKQVAVVNVATIGAESGRDLTLFDYSFYIETGLTFDPVKDTLRTVNKGLRFLSKDRLEQLEIQGVRTNGVGERFRV